ncbi:hypothetical protein Tco_1316715 [Tanacetum coccineum]
MPICGCLITRKRFWRNTVLGDKLVQLDVKDSKDCNAMFISQRLNTFGLSEVGAHSTVAADTAFKIMASTTTKIRSLPEEKVSVSSSRQIGMRCLTPAELEVLTKESA